MQRAAQAVAALNIVVVEDDPVVRQFLKETMEQLGHQIAGEAATGADMVRTVLAVEPDVVLFDIHLPGLNGLDALRQIYQERVSPRSPSPPTATRSWSAARWKNTSWPTSSSRSRRTRSARP